MHDGVVEPVISHTDVNTLMRLIADIRDDVFLIREEVVEDDGEEEEPEADA
jgi:hypothetical protein